MFFNLFKKKIEPEQEKINELLNEVKEKGKLPIYVNADVQEALRFLANNNGQIKLDDYTKGEILKIYDRWKQREKQPAKSDMVKVSKSEGFNKPQEEKEYIVETVWYNQEDGSFDYFEPEEQE